MVKMWKGMKYYDCLGNYNEKHKTGKCYCTYETQQDCIEYAKLQSLHRTPITEVE